MSCFLETYYSNLELYISHGVVFNEKKTMLVDSFQFEFLSQFAWEYDKIGTDCITFIWNSSLVMMCSTMFQSIVFVPWLVHDEHSLCISIINLISWCAVHPLRY